MKTIGKTDIFELPPVGAFSSTVGGAPPRMGIGGTPKDPKGHLKTPKEPHRDLQPPSVPKEYPQHVFDLPNLSKAPQKYVPSNHLILQISGKSSMHLKKRLPFSNIHYFCCLSTSR